MNSIDNATVYVVDDDPAFVNALSHVLTLAGFNVAPFLSAPAFLEYFAPQQPGCLISDVCMPEMNGLQLQQALADRHATLPIIFITGQGRVPMAVQALKAGAVDFLEKPFSDDELLDSVRRALARDATDRNMAVGRERTLQRLARLTPREREVLTLVVSHHSAKQIAQHLNISPRTVEHHREHAMAKMQARSQHDLVAMAIIGGIYEPHI